MNVVFKRMKQCENFRSFIREKSLQKFFFDVSVYIRKSGFDSQIQLKMKVLKTSLQPKYMHSTNKYIFTPICILLI